MAKEYYRRHNGERVAASGKGSPFVKASSNLPFHNLNDFILKTLQHVLLLSGDIETNPGPPVFGRDLCAVHINSQSIRHKIDLLTAEADKFDIITISESWLCPSDDSTALLIPGFHPPVRRDRLNDPHGGVAIYVRNDLICKPRPDLHVNELEAVWIETKLNQESILIGSFYRPPNSNVHYWSLISDSIRKTNNTGIKFVIMGDFNTDWLNTPSQNLNNILDFFQMKQHIVEPTRVTDTSSTCIDLVMAQDCRLIKRVEVLPEICSDHRVPCIYINCSKPRPKQFKRTIYNYNKLEHDKFNTLLRNTDWDQVLLSDNLNDSALNFTTTLLNIAKQCMPVKTIIVRSNDAPWINNEIKLLIAEKYKVHKTAKQSNKTEDWANFRQIRNTLTSKIRQRKIDYINELDSNVSDPNKFGKKEWWRLVNAFFSKKGLESDNIPPIDFNGKIYYSSKEKAEILNDYFVSQATIESNDDPVPDLIYSYDHALDRVRLSVDDVTKAINSLNNNKAVGPDLIHNRLLKSACSVIAEPLTCFFNKCLMESIFPNPWKIAHVTPLHKKGPKELCTNYRPISLLSCVGKLFETCIHRHVLQFLTVNNILTQSQSGFLPGDSTVNQLLCIYNNLCDSFDKEITTQAVYLDIAKAFDRVWHRGLLSKLEAVGIRGPLLRWFQDYLSNRKQATVVKGDKSSFKVVSAGVPQGSVLGPLLFLIYINDIVENINSVIKLFADDTSLSLALNNPALRAETLNHDLQTIENWGKAWKVKFNENKTELLNYIQGSNYCQPLTFGNSNLTNVKQHKHLGVILQDNFKWDSHVKAIITKVNMLISCLSSFKYRLGRLALETLYRSFIMPHFDYADTVWDSCSDTLSNTLEELHLQALRIISGSVRGTSHQKLYEETGFCSLKERRKRHKLTTLKKLTLGLGPNYLLDLLPPLVAATNPYPRRRPHDRVVPVHRTEVYRRSFFPSTTALWNDLPLSIQATTSINVFKRHFTNFDSVVPPYYYVGERCEQIIHCRLRLRMSNLNEDLFNRHLQLNKSCSCGNINESAEHFLLYCRNYENARHNTIATLCPDWSVTQTLLYGNPNLSLNENTTICLCVHDFIKQSGRFN